MKIKRISTYLTMVALSTATMTSMAQTQSELLVGNWQCGYSMDVDGMKMDMDMQVNYLSDGTANASARIDLVSAMLGMDLAYNVVASETWYIEGNTIFETMTEGNFESLKPSPYDALMTKDDLLPIGVEESSTILELTQQTFKITSGDIALDCTRK